MNCMSTANRQAIEEIKARLDLLQLVGRYVDLRQAGQRWVGVCPFHQETKPSLSVNPGQGFYYCFGCHAGGDGIDFYCRINGLEFGQGLEELARETGVRLEGKSSGRLEQHKAWSQVCLEANSLAQAFFSAALATDEAGQARRYLQQRGLKQETVQLFGLGWSPGHWQGLKDYLQKHGISPEQGLQAGLLSSSSQGRVYDRFRNRITFPIHDLQGRVVAFGGRLLKDAENQPKYLNSSESPVFKKGEHLYGLHQARKAVTQKKEVLLTEGYADVISMAQFGYLNTCGVLGTALTRAQIKRLAGLCSTVYLLFDGDRAGQQAALRSTEMILAAGLQAWVVRLPEDEDVDSLLHRQGTPALDQILQSAMDGLVFCLQMIRFNYSPQNMANWAREFLLQFQDFALQGYYLPRLAEGLQISEPELRKSLQGKSSPVRAGLKKEPDQQNRATAQRDRELLQFAVCYPDYLQELQSLELEQCLQTQRALDFWYKLLQYGHNQVFPELDQAERRFFSRCVTLQAKGAEAPPEIWQDIRAFLLRKKRRQKQKQVQQALHAAQQAGDSCRLSELLNEYSNLLREEE